MFIVIQSNSIHKYNKSFTIFLQLYKSNKNKYNNLLRWQSQINERWFAFVVLRATSKRKSGNQLSWHFLYLLHIHKYMGFMGEDLFKAICIIIYCLMNLVCFVFVENSVTSWNGKFVIIRWKFTTFHDYLLFMGFESWKGVELTIKEYSQHIQSCYRFVSWKSRHSWVKGWKYLYNKMKNDSIVLSYEASRCRKHQPEGRK